MTQYSTQVSKEHYRGSSYRGKDRWISYWRQLSLVRSFKPVSVLEIGVGDKTVTEAMRKDGVVVTMCDVAPDVEPDVVASVTALPFEDQSFDVVLAAEILEHIRYEDVAVAVGHIFRVCRKGAVISVPHAGWTFALEWKLPLLPRMSVCVKLPHFFKTHHFNGEHYWELGKRGYSRRRLRQIITNAGFVIAESRIHADDPAHVFFRLIKPNGSAV